MSARDAAPFYTTMRNDAAFATGDKRIFTAPAYKEQASAKPGLDHPDIEPARGQ